MSSNGNVGMNGDAFAADTDGVNPGANILESVIGTVTVKREKRRQVVKRNHKKT
jgi:hypothetical protein